MKFIGAATPRGGQTEHASDNGVYTLCGRIVYSKWDSFNPKSGFACKTCVREVALLEKVLNTAPTPQ